MQEHYRVRISDDSLVFSAAHFITLGPDGCEPLHGHNYRVAAEVSGPLDGDYCVLDFLLLRENLKAIVEQLDHRVLLPTESPSIRVTADGEEVAAAMGRRRCDLPPRGLRLAAGSEYHGRAIGPLRGRGAPGPFEDPHRLSAEPGADRGPRVLRAVCRV